MENKYKDLIGEKIKVADEKEFGVVTRIDTEKGLIYVLFKKMREETFPFPEAIDQGFLVTFKNK